MSLSYITLTARDGATARLSTQGAHLCSWIPAGGEEQLFLSTLSSTQPGVAIRGGVPVIFPQFAGLGTLPKHGFARTAEWKLLRSGLIENGAAEAVLELKENIARLTIWPYVFRLELRVVLLANTLHIHFQVDNTGDTPLRFTSALHTYLAVHDIADARVQGLQGCRYRDSVAGTSDNLENTARLSIEGETDRIYLNVPPQLQLQQTHQTTRIRTTGFTDAVVWNPGAAGAAQLADMEAGGETRMLCVEAATISHAISLTPGEHWYGSQTLEVIPPLQA